MATAKTSQSKSTCPTVSIAVNSSSVDGDTQKYSYALKYNTYGYTVSSSKKQTVKASIGGTTVYSGSIATSGKSGYTIKTGSITKSKAHSASTLAIKITIYWDDVYWGGVKLGTRSGSSSISLPKKTSYTVSYNANGGSGAPSASTKWYGETLTLSTTAPTRTGYTFRGWSTSSSATSATWAKGGSYTANASDVLYAVWTANTYTVTLNANGGSGGTASITKTYGKNVTLPSAANSPKKTNYTFLGWSTSKSATSASWAAGATYSTNITTNTTLYAVWKLAYIAPKISGLKCYRCDANGNSADEGTYGHVEFTWSVDRTIDTSNGMASLAITANGATVWTAEEGIGQTSGTVSEVISGFDTETEYTITVTLNDSYAYGTPKSENGFIDSAIYTIDVLKGGKGMAFGKIAENEGYLDSAWNVVMDRTKTIYGRTTNNDLYSVFTPMNSSDNTIIGYGHYAKSYGNTIIYGNEVYIIPKTAGQSIRPYYRKGDSLAIAWNGAGYVTSGGYGVRFCITLDKPVVGVSAVAGESTDGFMIRQDGKYLYGGTSSARVKTGKIACYLRDCSIIYVDVTFPNNTNVTNNDTLGIAWDGTLTFS